MDEKKVAIITGGGKGIGRACALRLALNGIFVVVNYFSSESEANELVKEIINSGGSAAAYKCDVSDTVATEEMFKNIYDNYGRIDILVNNSGVKKDCITVAMESADFDSVISINLKGTFNCVKASLKYMLKKRYGRIINISSISGLHGNVGQANYSASKAGIIGLTKSVAKEVAKKGITVNAVAPGFVETEMVVGIDEDTKKQLCKEIPVGRLASVNEIAFVVSMLVSDEAGYITGSVYNIDGGLGI